MPKQPKPDEDEPSEMDKHKNLMGALLKVPKTEADDLRKKRKSEN